MRFSTLLPYATLAAVSLATAMPERRDTITNPTIVIAPGAWQLPPTWDNYLGLLRRAGYDAVLVPHLSVGVDMEPLAGLHEDTKNFQATLSKLADQGKKMVLFGHSYGGAVIAAATQDYDVATRQAAGKPGGVLLTAFMSAFVVPSGSTVLKLLGNKVLPWMIVKDDKVLTNSTLLGNIGYNGLSPQEIDYYVNLTTWTALNAFTQENMYEPWNYKVPAAYIHTTLDNALPLATQNEMVERLATTTHKVYSMTTGHSSFLVDPVGCMKIWEDIVKFAVSSAASQ